MHVHGDPPAVTTDDELLPDEPQTPAWLTMVGGVLFLAGIVTFVALRPPAKTADELQRESQAAAEERAAARAALQAPPAPPMPAPQAPTPMPGGQQAPAPGRGG